MHDEGVIHFLSILFKYPILGGSFQGVSLQYCKSKYSFYYFPIDDNSIFFFLTLDQIEFGVSDLGMYNLRIIIECPCLVSILKWCP